jgi:hypothetical protein
LRVPARPECDHSPPSAGLFFGHTSSVSVVPLLFKLGATAALAAAVSLPPAAHAGVADFIRTQTAAQARDLVASARAMPADRYRYSPGAEQMTFGELVLHVADGNYLFCSPIGSTDSPAVEKLAGDGPKEALVKRLQDSFDFCARALAPLDDAKMSEMLLIGNVRSPRSMAILTLSGTWNTHLTMARDYLSKNGQTVPSPAR